MPKQWFLFVANKAFISHSLMSISVAARVPSSSLNQFLMHID